MLLLTLYNNSLVLMWSDSGYLVYLHYNDQTLTAIVTSHPGLQRKL